MEHHFYADRFAELRLTYSDPHKLFPMVPSTPTAQFASFEMPLERQTILMEEDDCGFQGGNSGEFTPTLPKASTDSVESHGS